MLAAVRFACAMRWDLFAAQLSRLSPSLRSEFAGEEDGAELDLMPALYLCGLVILNHLCLAIEHTEAIIVYIQAIQAMFGRQDLRIMIQKRHGNCPGQVIPLRRWLYPRELQGVCRRGGSTPS